MGVLSQAKLPPGANRILFVKNLNYQITGEDLYDLFGRYGSIRQIRIGNEPKTKGTAFVVFDDVMDVFGLFHPLPLNRVTDSFYYRPRMHWSI
jgi:RNA recognition motif. (a.k.a. RRM, RBD, or RNP domain)